MSADRFPTYLYVKKYISGTAPGHFFLVLLLKLLSEIKTKKEAEAYI